jgi:hypothetical protein
MIRPCIGLVETWIDKKSYLRAALCWQEESHSKSQPPLLFFSQLFLCCHPGLLLSQWPPSSVTSFVHRCKGAHCLSCR